MARVRRRGHSAVLCASASRSRPDQINPPEDHCRQHGLALPRRAQARAEGVSVKQQGEVRMPITQTRCRFLTTLSLAGATGLLRTLPSLAAEGALETTTVRIGKVTAICLAPQYVSEELLRAEGFTDIRYVEVSDPAAIGRAIGRGEADFSTAFAIDAIQAIDAGAPIVVLAGVHVGCYELFAKQDIRRITELKGESVA